MKDALVIGDTLDSKNVGISRMRDADRKWQKLYSQLQSIKATFIDKSLNQLIDQYINHSYGSNSLLLHLTYLKKCSPEDYQTPELSRLNVSNLVIKMDSEMTDLLVKIVKKARQVKN